MFTLLKRLKKSTEPWSTKRSPMWKSLASRKSVSKYAGIRKLFRPKKGTRLDPEIPITPPLVGPVVKLPGALGRLPLTAALNGPPVDALIIGEIVQPERRYLAPLLSLLAKFSGCQMADTPNLCRMSKFDGE